MQDYNFVLNFGRATSRINSKLFSALVVLSVHVIVLFLSLSILLPVVHADSVMATIPVNQHPLDFAFNTANNQVYLGHASTGLMSVIDGQSNGVIKIIPISNTYFYGLAYNPTNQHMYVANDTGPVGSVAVIDPSTGTLIKSIPVGDSPVQTLYNPFNGFIYVTDTNSQRVEVIDASTNTVIKTIPVGIGPIGMAYNANNHNVYVANSNQFSSSVSVIDSTSNSVIKTIPIPGSPWRITFNSNNGNMYVTLIGAKNVAVIDGSTNTVIKTIPMPVFPPYPGSPFGGTSVGSIVYNPFNNFVYVSHMNSEYVTGIDAATDTVTKTIKVGHYPFTVGYLSTNHNIYVANHDSNTVSVIGTNNTTTTSQAVCPEENVNHWDKIVFMIMSPVLAEKVHVLPFTELDIKVLDNPKQVADLKQKVLNFLGAPNGNRNSIKIIDVDYAIICATKGPVVLYPQKEPALNQTANTTTMKIPTNATMLNSNMTNKSSSLNTTIPEQVPPQSVNGSKAVKI
jgi:YVTN family beta-propeller protein